MSDQAIWLTEADIAELVSINTGIEALRDLLPREVTGGARNLSKVLAIWPPRSSMHNLGSVDPERGVGGIKSWVNTPEGAQAVYVLFDTRKGQVLAMMQAGTLGALRTAGISGLATGLMADPGADSLSVIGAGRQALGQVASVATVRPLRKIHVFSRTEESKQAFCEALRAKFDAEIVAEPTLESAVKAAPILTLVTRASEPFVTAEMIAPGTHVNAVGAILPANAELTPDAMTVFDRFVVDNIDNARLSSAELRDHFGEDDAKWQALPTVGGLLASGGFRYTPGQTTCFKAMGMGLSDLAIAVAALGRARELGVGAPLGSEKSGGMSWDALSAAQAGGAAQ
ncbi:ornithine cyclodeaminase family protein [Salipiger abyssi]|uniref:ornithine cyclodeaminase family protein n=1 Tax=Salipiger abyssi TaxID=1250539 RepID=UPI00405A23E6